MCHYITLVADVDQRALDAIMRGHGRTAREVSNASLAGVLREGERQFMTTLACDCGTALDRNREQTPEIDLNQAHARLAKRGWSEEKIRRWIDAKRKALANSAAREERESPDSIELWAACLRQIQAELKPRSVGLFLHFYAGTLETERFRATRIEVEPGRSVESALEHLQEDILLMMPKA